MREKAPRKNQFNSQHASNVSTQLRAIMSQLKAAVKCCGEQKPWDPNTNQLWRNIWKRERRLKSCGQWGIKCCGLRIIPLFFTIFHLIAHILLEHTHTHIYRLLPPWPFSTWVSCVYVGSISHKRHEAAGLRSWRMKNFIPFHSNFFSTSSHMNIPIQTVSQRRRYALLVERKGNFSILIAAREIEEKQGSSWRDGSEREKISHVYRLLFRNINFFLLRSSYILFVSQLLWLEHRGVCAGSV